MNVTPCCSSTNSCSVSLNTVLTITFTVIAVSSAVFLALSYHEILLPQSATVYFSISLAISFMLLSFTSNCFGLCEDSSVAQETSSPSEKARPAKSAEPQLVTGGRTQFLQTAFPEISMISHRVAFHFGQDPKRFTWHSQTTFFEEGTPVSFDYLCFSPSQIEAHEKEFPQKQPFGISFDSPQDSIRALYDSLFCHFNSHAEKRGPIAMTDGTSHYLLLGISRKPTNPDPLDTLKPSSSDPVVTLWLADPQVSDPQEKGFYTLSLDSEGNTLPPSTFHFRKEWTFRFPQMESPS